MFYSNCHGAADVQVELETTRCFIEESEQHIKRIDDTLEVDAVAAQEIGLRSQRLTQIVQATEVKLDRETTTTIAQQLQASLNAEDNSKPVTVTQTQDRMKGNMADEVSNHRTVENSLTLRRRLKVCYFSFTFRLPRFLLASGDCF